MAINSEEKAAKARELLAKLQSATDLTPLEAERTNANIDRLRASLGEYDKSSRPVDQTGKLTADVPGNEHKVEGFDTDGGYFYEPSVDSVKQRLMSDPSLSERLNLRSWTSSPDQIDRLTDQDTAYSAVADDDWKRARTEAQTGKKNLSRYSKVQLKDNPLDKVVGFANKHLPAIGLGIAKAIAPIAPRGDETHEAWKQKALSASPEGETIGSFIGAASPASAGSQIGNLAMKAGNYAARSPLGKAAISGASGALGSVVEGEMGAIDDEMHQEDPELQDYFDGIQERVTGNAIYGGALGAGGDVVAQGSKALSQRLRESPRFEDVNKLRDAGGDTHLGWGVKVPENVQQNISAVAKPGSIGRPEDIAAAKIAPKIADSVDQQAQSAYRQAGESLENYHRSDQGKAAKRVTKPARVMLDMIREGQNVGDLGTVGDAVPKIAKKLRDRLMNEVERKEVSLDEYDRLKSQYGDDIIDLDPSDADNILGSVKQEPVQASVQPRAKPSAQEPVLQNPFDPPAKKNVTPEMVAETAIPEVESFQEPVAQQKTPDIDKKLHPALEIFKSAGGPINKVELAEKLGIKNRPEWEVEQLEKAGLIRRVPNPPGGVHGVEGRFEIVGQEPPAASPAADVRQAGTIPPKGKKKKADGIVPALPDRDAKPTIEMPVTNAARHEYGQKMYPYRDAMRGSDLKTADLMDEFPYVDNGPAREGPSELETARTELPEFDPLPESNIEDISGSDIEELSVSPEPESAPPATPVKIGNKVVLIPRARNSRQIEKIQQDIAEDLQGISKDSDWLKKVDKAFRETRDQFEPNEFTPGEMILDDGTKVTGLSALQRQHHQMLDKINEMKTDTSVNSRNAIHNKVRGFNTAGNYLSDQQMMEEAKKIGVEQQLREVAGSAVAPSLKERSIAGGPRGIVQGALDAGLFRADALLRTIGNTPPNPFTAPPNTPSARIQQYLFENAAKNLLNFEGGRLGRFGNEAKDLKDKGK